MRPFAYLLLLLGFCLAASTEAAEILHWDRLPLSIPLLVGTERVIIVGDPLRVGLPSSLDGRLRVQSANGAAYLLARTPIETAQIELQDLRTGELILIDITARLPARHQEALEPIQIVDDEVANTSAGAISTAGTPSLKDSTETQATTPTPLAVALTRYAAQSLYAPLRTVEPLPGIMQAPVPFDLLLDELLPTLPVRGTALAAWHLSGEWVTAVKLTNTSARWIDLDPRFLQGTFVAATFQHPNLGPAGHSTDTTVVYLITRGSGLSELKSRFDAMLDVGRSQSASGQGGASRAR